MAPELRRGSCALLDPGLPWRDGDTCAFRNHQSEYVGVETCQLVSER